MVVILSFPSPKRKCDEMENGDSTNGDAEEKSQEGDPDEVKDEVKDVYFSSLIVTWDF